MPPPTDIKEALPLLYLEIGEGEVPRERVSESAGPKALTCTRICLRVAMLRGFHTWQMYQQLVGFAFYWTLRNSNDFPGQSLVRRLKQNNRPDSHNLRMCESPRNYNMLLHAYCSTTEKVLLLADVVVDRSIHVE